MPERTRGRLWVVGWSGMVPIVPVRRLRSACGRGNAVPEVRCRRKPFASPRGRWQGALMGLGDVPTLTDGVVTLRRHREADVDAVVEQSRDPLSRRWTKVPHPYGRDDARRFVRDVMPGGWAADQEWAFAVEAVDDGAARYAGTVSLRSEGEGRAEIAYGSHPWARGHGIMERALRLLLAWGFSPVQEGGRGLDTVIWWAEVGNWSSRRLAWKVGFPCDGTVRRWL